VVTQLYRKDERLVLSKLYPTIPPVALIAFTPLLFFFFSYVAVTPLLFTNITPLEMRWYAILAFLALFFAGPVRAGLEELAAALPSCAVSKNVLEKLQV
jgi:polyferredoxin